MFDHFKAILGEERHNQLLQEAEGKTYEELLNERDELQYNWTKLREMIEQTIVALHEHVKDPTDDFVTTSVGTFGRVLNMMDELESKGDINNG